MVFSQSQQQLRGRSALVTARARFITPLRQLFSLRGRLGAGLAEARCARRWLRPWLCAWSIVGVRGGTTRPQRQQLSLQHRRYYNDHVIGRLVNVGRGVLLAQQQLARQFANSEFAVFLTFSRIWAVSGLLLREYKQLLLRVGAYDDFFLGVELPVGGRGTGIALSSLTPEMACFFASVGSDTAGVVFTEFTPQRGGAACFLHVTSTSIHYNTIFAYNGVMYQAGGFTATSALATVSRIVVVSKGVSSGSCLFWSSILGDLLTPDVFITRGVTSAEINYLATGARAAFRSPTVAWRDAAMFSLACTDSCGESLYESTLPNLRSFLQTTATRLPQLFQLRFCLLNRRIRKILKNARKYRRVCKYVLPSKRLTALGRYLAFFFRFAPHSVRSARIYSVIQQIIVKPEDSAAVLVYQKQQVNVLASFVRHLV